MIGSPNATLAVLALVLIAGGSPSRAASECPTAASGKGSYVVERGKGSVTEVSYDDGPMVRTTLKFNGRTLLETTLYQGLFELDRLDRGTKIESRPKTDLGRFFPLKPQQTISADFDLVMSGPGPRIRTVKLRYVGVQGFSIGDCTYSVLKLQRNENFPVYDNVDYYAPELKLVVAKEYAERDGRKTIIGYTGISSGAP